jgi:exosortase
MTDVSVSPTGLGHSQIDSARRVTDVLRSPAYMATRRVIAAAGLIVIAFHYSLTTLVRTLKDQTPLAYLGLVPLIALLMAAGRLWPAEGEPAIHDRQVDYIIGLPLLIGSIFFEVFMPIRMSTLFWLYRMDLLVLPMFAAGTIAVLFGTRVLWRLKLPVLFLLLAWPLPYETLLVRGLSAFTSSTLSGLNVLLRVVTVASPYAGKGSGLYQIHHGGSSFLVSVASACSGVNGIVGYLLVAVAFSTMVTGRFAAKAAWLACGLAGVWTSNVIRIVIILTAGHWWGEHIALKVLHPFMGLVTFNIVVLAMVLVMGRFRLSFASSRKRSGAALAAHLHRAVPRLRLALAVIAGFAAVAYVANSALQGYDLVLSSLGAPRLVAFSQAPSHPDGWRVDHVDTYTWATPFFGEDSTWYRYDYTFQGGNAPLKSDTPIIADVINTSDLSSFSTYGIEACYRFHGYKLYSIRTVDLGGGVTGNVLSYYNTAVKSDWTTVYWHWPVKADNGSIRYERVTLMLLNTAHASFTGPSPSTGLLRSLGLGVENALVAKGSSVDAKLARTRTFLVEFARAVIDGQAAISNSAPAHHIAASRGA